MLRVAVVDDDPSAAQTLLNYLDRFQQDHEAVFQITRFSDGSAFLDQYQSDFDIVLMDIEMPNMDGMEAARRLRQVDATACLIFVTNMAQFAVKGYEVNAMDFLVKPVTYSVFSYKLEKAVFTIGRRQTPELVLKTKSGIIRMNIRDLHYVEVNRHKVFYHGVQGTVEAWSTLTQVERKLSPYGGFSRCNACYLINLRCVSKIEGNWVFLGTERLEISRGKKAGFMQDLVDFLGV